jgi:hypothetical protein
MTTGFLLQSFHSFGSMNLFAVAVAFPSYMIKLAIICKIRRNGWGGLKYNEIVEKRGEKFSVALYDCLPLAPYCHDGKQDGFPIDQFNFLREVIIILRKDKLTPKNGNERAGTCFHKYFKIRNTNRQKDSSLYIYIIESSFYMIRRIMDDSS